MSEQLNWFDVEVAIRRNSDGAVRIYKCREALDDEGGYGSVDYGWSDGNYGCDCNRALFFARAADEPDLDVPCGESAYTVEWIKRADSGEIIYRDET